MSMKKCANGEDAVAEKTQFDTLKAAQALREAGVSEEQAKAHVEIIQMAMSDSVATKADVKLAREENKAGLAKLGADLMKVKSDLIMWFVGTMLAFAGLIIAAIKL